MDNQFDIAKNIYELEQLYGFMAGNGRRYRYDIKKVPEGFRFLKPYIDYFCIQDQADREYFHQNLPIQAFRDLEMVIEPIFTELVFWLGGDEAKKTPMSDEYIALSILSLLPEEHLNKFKPPPSSLSLTNEQKDKVSQLLKLNTSELIDYWKVPNDSFKRIAVDIDEIPAQFKTLHSLINLVDVEQDDERIQFLSTIPPAAIADIEMILASFGNEIRHYLIFDSMYTPPTNELTALEILQWVPIEYNRALRKNNGT